VFDPDAPPLSPLPGRQLEIVIAHLDQASYNHDQWYRNLVRVLVARLPPDDADLRRDAHQRCRFGQWYESDSIPALREQPAFIALGDAHRSMHDSARRLLQRVDHDLPISANDLDQFSNHLDHMRLELESLRRDLVEMARNRDPLTDARNRGSLLADLREQHALVRRGLQECALVMIDLDHFKAINDTHGHGMGDAVLRGVAQYLQANMRAYDHLYRYGGEEFLLCAPHTSAPQAAALAERLRAGLAELRIHASADDAGVGVTASFGVALLDGALTVEDGIEQADQAMYRAKEAGRNCVSADFARS